jgi:hypothetical protein
MTNALEFIDYIFDRYAFLGIDAATPAEELRREIRRRRAENHPDKLLHVSEAIRQTAARDMELVNECARVLLDDTLRTRYDERLAVFRESSPQLISTSGVPIIDPTRFRIDLEALLDTNVTDLADLEAQAAKLAGYNERRLERARKQFANDPDDVDAREELRDHLTAKLVFLNVIEDYYWQKAGVHGATDKNASLRTTHSSDILALLENQVSQVRAKVEHAVAERHNVAQLGFVPLLLLGHHGTESESALVVQEVTAVAVRSFEMRVEDLKALVESKKLTVDELVRVARSRELRAPTGTTVIDVMLIQSEAEPDAAWPGDDFVQLGIIFRCDIAAGAISSVSTTLSAEEIAAWPNELHALEPNRELPGFLIEAVALVERLAESRQMQANTPEPGQADAS